MAAKKRPVPPANSIRAGQRAVVTVLDVKHAKGSSWSVIVGAPPRSVDVLGTMMEGTTREALVPLAVDRRAAVRAGAAIARALWEVGGVPAQLIVRNQDGTFAEERSYPDVTPRRKG